MTVSARQQALALEPLALQFAIAANGLGAFPCTFFGWFLVMTPELHLAKDAFSLHLLFQRFQRLIDIVVANDDLQAGLLLLSGAGSYQNMAILSTAAREGNAAKTIRLRSEM